MRPFCVRFCRLNLTICASLIGIFIPLVTVATEYIRVPSKSSINDLPIELLREVIRRHQNFRLSYPYEADLEIATKQR